MTFENRETVDKRNERHNSNYPNLSPFDKTYLHSKLLLSTGYLALTKEDKRSQERPSCREMIGEKEKAII
jgi:hypothetical protein